MRYRRMGASGIQLSTVSIGGWLTLGKVVSDKQGRKILRHAVEGGINFIDLADIYARGDAEKATAEFLREARRSDLVLSSKVFWPMSDNINDRGLSRKHIVESVEKSLRRLGTDYLDLYFCHRWDDNTPLEETMRAMDDLVHQGKVLYWGTSVWTADQLQRAHGLADRRNLYAPVVEQPRYHLLDRHIEDAILPTCAELGIGLVVWSPLAQGLLTGKYNDGVPDDSRGGRKDWELEFLTAENIERVRQLSAIAAELGITTGQLALAWILAHPEITSVITGATSFDQVEENLAAAEIDLSTETVARIEALFPRP